MTKKLVLVGPDKLDDGAANPQAGVPTGVIRFTFEDKETEDFDLSKVSDDMKFRLAIHGASQKIGDSYASASQATDAVAFAKAAVKETIAQLYAGTWRATVSAGPKANDLALAMSRVDGDTSLEDCIELVGAMSDDEKKVWKKKPKIAAQIALIAVERAQAKANKLAELAAKADAAEQAKA